MIAIGQRFSLAGRVALVTGASTGLRRHVAGALMQAGTLLTGGVLAACWR